MMGIDSLPAASSHELRTMNTYHMAPNVNRKVLNRNIYVTRNQSNMKIDVSLPFNITGKCSHINNNSDR